MRGTNDLQIQFYSGYAFPSYYTNTHARMYICMCIRNNVVVGMLVANKRINICDIRYRTSCSNRYNDTSYRHRTGWSEIVQRRKYAETCTSSVTCTTCFAAYCQMRIYLLKIYHSINDKKRCYKTLKYVRSEAPFHFSSSWNYFVYDENYLPQNDKAGTSVFDLWPDL